MFYQTIEITKLYHLPSPKSQMAPLNSQNDCQLGYEIEIFSNFIFLLTT